MAQILDPYRFAQTGGSGPASTLLIHSDASNGSTAFTDSAGGKTVTVVGAAAHSTAQQKFGASSISLPGSDDALSLPAGADWAFGTGDFTVDIWVFPTADASVNAVTRTIIGNGSGAGQWELRAGHAGNNYFTFGSSSSYDLLQYASTFTKNAWTHLAVVRESGVLGLLVAGVVRDRTTTGVDLSSTAKDLHIGDSAGYPANPDFAGYVDEVRIIKGTAAWPLGGKSVGDAVFTPPSAPYGS